MTTALLLIGGLVLLLVGGEALVRGAVGAAGRMRLSPLLVGTVIAGFGTSTPEMVVSVDATLVGTPAIAAGNVIGSNIANILLILGLAAVIRPVARPDHGLADGLVLLAVTVGLAGLCVIGTIPAWAGVAMIGLMAVIVAAHYRRDRRMTRIAVADRLPEPAHGVVPAKTWTVVLALALAFPALIVGADLLVEGALRAATTFGLSEAVIGLTIVAIGTSLPELATTTVAAYRGHGAVAYGNIAGSNLFNALAIMGAASIAGPLTIPRMMAWVDGPVMVAATALMLVLILARPSGIGRGGGVLLLGLFVAYLVGRVALGAA